MARTAKRYKKNTEKKVLGIPVCMAAIYVRLSVDSDEKKSESIETQVTLIKEFIQKHNENPNREYEIAVYNIYSDLGKTGTNFDRPGFERMMNDVREGKINCILVKDFSRFGRNYIETGNYLEKINGIYKLMVEPEAAKIVRRIFEEYASGDGIQGIIDRLFEDRVHRISDYNQYHHVYCQDGENLHQWGNSSIRAVLNRNNYYGDLVQRKYESRFQRGEKWCDILDESQWIITPNAHEPIISRELFEKAQVRLKAAQQKATKTTAGWEDDERAFYNVFYCGDCKRKMCTRRYRGNVYYFCNAAWYRDERKCSHKSISEEKLQKIVRSELTRQFQLSGLRKKDMSVISSAVFLSKINEIQTEIRKLDADMERRSEKLAQAFMKYKEGELSKEAYIEMKDDRNNWKEFCEERKKSLEQTIRKLEKQQKEEARFLRSLLELDGTTRINAELAEGLIESMYLYGDGRLEINFGFKGAVEHE
ncbi:MAG: recombinase family protein [Ruminococcus sp.]|nr:recombinase family protein [Ruminococcus sp.]